MLDYRNLQLQRIQEIQKQSPVLGRATGVCFVDAKWAPPLVEINSGQS